ncbi:MAG: hypothetical protein Q4A84_03645 [Neisseria sp.]|uniref:hypothetical protein n=1 Tax=Neisseria sp. TaxID=192066 RepID=UPI0026DB85D7|nr:hypothetical protein [Neisseria sp.]MDO4640783.1 hypothetical protein [Neisseria sp.]
MNQQNHHTAKLNTRFYACLPDVLSNYHVLSNMENLSEKDKWRLQLSIDGSIVTLGNILETAGRLVEAHNHVDTINRIESEDINRFILDLNTTVGGLMVALSEIYSDLSCCEKASE